MNRVKLPSGIEIAYDESGPRDAPALIFLHGFPENRRSWRHQIAHLSGTHRCIAPDQRGYGDSSKPQSVGDYSYDKLIGDIFQLADALEIESFTILGHDWGGAVAWGVAAFGQANGRVTRAIIANAPHPAVFQQLLFMDKDQRAASQYMRAFRDTGNDALVEQHGLAALLARALGGQVSTPFDPEERKILLSQWQDPATAFAMLNWYRGSAIQVPAMDEPLGLPAGFETPPFPSITIPTLVIWGMDDAALLPSNVDGMASCVANLTVEEVPGSGHFVQWEKPDETNRAIDAFLARTSAA